ncbi:hypothetical protein [Kordiimonas marina]|uniref:hypothetical protein n=1 Tax=Kordiimonas marina TaxID=2872312 RepID=UPI001FF38C9C|nr:hypothetical protein [Kordiimonas marina]MCJ9428682.1 hypothetical protein [Kordiimonas marina]
MRKVIAAAVLAFSVVGATAPALAAPFWNYLKTDQRWLYIDYKGNQSRYAPTSEEWRFLCTFKQRVAERFNLDMKKFTLTSDGRKLYPNPVSDSGGLVPLSTIKIVETDYSDQCTR